MDSADVVVVGGGPSGCYVGALLAERGFRVTIVEEHREVGKPTCCAGVVGLEGMKKIGINISGHVLSKLRRAIVHSPSGHSVELGRKKVEAAVIDRAGFDRWLAENAVGAGARIWTNTRCVGVKVGDRVEVKLSGSHSGGLGAELLVGADGASSAVARMVGLAPRKREFIFCSQTELRGRCEGDAAEIFLGRNYAPGFFGWMVKAGDWCRIGTGTITGSPIDCLKRLINTNPALRGRISVPKKLSACAKPIPSFFIRRPWGKRVMLVGDAAGQVKPLTGGGIYFGLKCAALAANAATTWFEERGRRKTLSGYGRGVQVMFSREVSAGEFARKLFRSLSDEELNALVRSLHGSAGDIVLRNFDFDSHSNVILPLLRSMPLLMPEIGIKRSVKISTKLLFRRFSQSS